MSSRKTIAATTLLFALTIFVTFSVVIFAQDPPLDSPVATPTPAVDIEPLPEPDPTPQPEPPPDSVALAILGIYGLAVAFVQERFGTFNDLSPRSKQLINSIAAFVVPAVANLLTPIWRPELGDVSAVVYGLVLLLAPASVWLVSQVGHAADKKLIA
jgi:hypothetical protein